MQKFLKSNGRRSLPIFFILALALTVRLYNVNAPLVGFHAWRQADTMTIAKNFYENGFNFLLPQVDWGGNTPGYVETEFPVYQYLLSLLFIFSGVSEFAARLVSIFFSLLSIFAFYRLIGRISDQGTALWTAFFVSILPLTVFMGRTIMPESLLMLSVVCGIYFFLDWLDKERLSAFLLSLFFVSLACLIKPPTLYLGLPLGWLAWLKYKGKLFFQWNLWIFGGGVFLALFLWYFHAHQVYLQNGLTFGVWEYQTDKWGKWQLLAAPNYWTTIFGNYIGVLTLAVAGVPLFLLGLSLKRRTPREYFFDFWLAALFIYFLIVNQGNLWHFYYQLPFAFPAAYFIGRLFGGRFNAADKKRFAALAAALALLVYASSLVYRDILMAREDPNLSSNDELAALIRSSAAPGDLVVVLDDGDPTVLYLAERKGWHGFLKPNLENSLALEEKRAQGAKYFAGDFISCGKSSETNCVALNDILNRYPAVFKDENFFMVDLAR